MKAVIFWFRRDLRIEDNTGLNKALEAGIPVLPIFIFDETIIRELPPYDARVNFIYDTLLSINQELDQKNSSLLILKGDPLHVWKELIDKYEIEAVFANKDYEPYASERDGKVKALLNGSAVPFHLFKDQVIFEENEVLKNDGKPYTVFTPYKNRWLARFNENPVLPNKKIAFDSLCLEKHPFPKLHDIGFRSSTVKVNDYDLSQLDHYAAERNFPARDSTSYLSPHLRFGTVSIREIIQQLGPQHEVFLSELIWREFFMQILFHFPRVVDQNFNTKYDGIKWRNNREEFEQWCRGETGYPMVDAGMRQLNETGYMHNRVRMVTASFLCKHLLIDWRWGEAYFAEKLLDYELSSNNGNWQWAAGTGCDAAPYFRIFNPSEQLKKFDKDLKYVKRWVPEYGTSSYSLPVVEHKAARVRALESYKVGLKGI